VTEEKTRGRRPKTRFWVWAEQWLLGSTRTELTNEERAVFMDFLCLAALSGGCVEVYSRDQLTSQLFISRELLDKCIEKFIKTGKIYRKYKKREKKEIFCLVKWEQYQPEYLWQNPHRSTRKKCSAKGNKNDAHVDTKGEERRKEENGIKENGKNEKYPNETRQNSPLNSSLSIKEEFLLALKECKGYPFDEVKDSLLFDITVKDYPGINIMKQVRRKIEWWKNHPDALKADPRKQLFKWFKKEYKFKQSGGPQPIGEILPDVNDPDKRRFLKLLFEGNKEKEKA